MPIIEHTSISKMKKQLILEIDNYIRNNIEDTKEELKDRITDFIYPLINTPYSEQVEILLENLSFGHIGDRTKIYLPENPNAFSIIRANIYVVLTEHANEYIDSLVPYLTNPKDL